MNKYLLLFMIILTGVFFSHAEKSGARYHYHGTIDNKHELLMNLTVDNNSLIGNYLYYSVGSSLELEGTCKKDLSFAFSEYVDEECTGVFTGTFAAEFLSAEGFWHTPDKSKEFPFRVTLFANERSLTSDYEDIHAWYPEFVGFPDGVTRGLNSRIRETTEKAFDTFLEAYGIEMIEFPELEWSLSLDYTITYYSEDLVSILIENYEYSGGAHGNVYYGVFNYDLRSDNVKPIVLDDLFKSNTQYLTLLTALNLEDLKQQGASWVLDGSVEELTDALGVFNITPRGLLFTFAPYLVGPYAEGVYEVTIPFNKLKNIIDPTGPLGRF